MAAIAESILYYVMYINNVNIYINTTISISFVVLVRYLAYRFKINLPVVDLSHKEKKDENNMIN